MGEDLRFVLWPSDIDSGKVTMEGWVYKGSSNCVDFEPYKINIGTSTDGKFEVIAHGEPVASLDAKQLKQYFSHRGVKVYDYVDDIFDVMTVIKAASNGFSREIFRYLHSGKTNFEHPEDAALTFDSKVLEKIKKDTEIIEALNNYHAQFGALGGPITPEVKEYEAQKNYPFLDRLIEHVFIKNEAGFDEW